MKKVMRDIHSLLDDDLRIDIWSAVVRGAIRLEQDDNCYYLGGDKHFRSLQPLLQINYLRKSWLVISSALKVYDPKLSDKIEDLIKDYPSK
jgi:hypothetical protein